MPASSPALAAALLIVLTAGCGHSAAAAPANPGRPFAGGVEDEGVASFAAEERMATAEAPPPARADAPAIVRVPRAAASAPSPETPGDQMIVSGTVSVRTDDVGALVRSVRAHVADAGGTVVGETVDGNADEGRATMRLRLPPAATFAFADWLATQATLESRNLEASDVSRQYLDQALALKNLQITMGRLQELAGRSDAKLNEVLEVERELTRVRGEIERLEGEHRALADRIARATLTVNILPRRGTHPVVAHDEPELKFELAPHLTLLHFVDEGARHQNRVGGGVTLIFARAFALDATVLPRRDADARSYLFSASFAGYSDFLGGGRRRFGNPYLGLRLGTGWVNDHGLFSAGAEAGVELVRTKLFLVDLTGRVLGFVYGKGVPNDLVLEGVLAAGVPF
ncbi:MAG TPA: DUF4349 domain-containing protein [Polyangia bacterium]|nr:DUF4349 domain-containing protein [Polyangia bacterium]